MDDLERAVDTIVSPGLGVSAGETVVAVADTSIRPPGSIAGFAGTVRLPVHLDGVVLTTSLDMGGPRVLEAGDFPLDA